MRQKNKVGIAPKAEIEAALRESEQRLRWLASIVDSSDDAIVSKTLDGFITSWNSGAERVFGYFASEAIGKPITLVIPQDRQSEEHEILTRIRRGERIDHFETVRQHKNGSFIVVSLTVSPVKDANGKIVGASKIARDITEQKKNQELIVTLAREAEHRSKNLLANALATVNLSQSSSTEGLKQVIAGRIQALANVCSSFRGNALGRCRAISDCGTATSSLFRDEWEANCHRWPGNPIRARRRSGSCDNVARVGDQRREIRCFVHARWPSPLGVVTCG